MLPDDRSSNGAVSAATKPAEQNEADDNDPAGARGPQLPAEGERCITLRMPAEAELRKVARLVVSSIGAVVSFDIEQLADLRLAGDELCSLVTAGALPGCTLQLTVLWNERSIELLAAASPVGEEAAQTLDEEWPAGLDPAKLSEKILEALTDGFGVEEFVDQTRRAWLRKTR